MRFCVVGPAYPFRGGIAHHTTLLCRHLAERHEVSAVTFKRLYPSILFPGKSQTDNSREAATFEAEAVIDSMNPLTWVEAGNRIQAMRPDYVLAQWWQPFFAPCLASVLSRVHHARVIFICHNVLPHEGMPFARTLSLWALRHGDGFIVHSDKDRMDLEHILPYLPSDAVRKTIHPQYEIFPASGMTKEDARSRLGIPGRTLLFFGLIRRYKGLMDLIDALAVVRNKELTCLVAGEFYESKSRYLERIKEHGLDGRIRVIDRYIPNEEVESYFAAADVVVLPYRTATQSGVAQMAYRYGRPVIATAVGGLPESIDDGRTGLLVPSEDPRALADAIDRYYDEGLEDRFVDAIHEDIGRFSWDRVIQAIEALGGSL